MWVAILRLQTFCYNHFHYFFNKQTKQKTFWLEENECVIYSQWLHQGDG